MYLLIGDRRNMLCAIPQLRCTKALMADLAFADEILLFARTG